MQISKLYETKLECSSYNVNIDSTDTTVTLTLVDFNGSPVTNTEVTLKADKGYFTKAVGKTTTTYTDASATKTINATTDNNGKVVATWTASEWGLCTFSANNGNVQSNVQGWKRIYSNTSGTVTLYRNQDLFRLRGDDHSVSLTSSNAWQDRMSFAEYFKPDTIYYSITSYTNTIFCRILSSGQFQMKNTSGSSFNNPISFAILGKLDES